MLSIIIVTYRSWELLEENLRHLLDSAGLNPGQPPPWEIIVVNNDADHDEAGAISLKETFPHVRVIQAHGDLGYAYACNRGAEIARGDALLFMGSDLKATSSALDSLLRGLTDHPGYGILTAPQEDLSGRLQRSFAPFTRLSNYFSISRWIQRRLRPARNLDPRTSPEALPELLPVEWVSGSLVLVRRDVFEAIGGWNEDLWLYCEDEDLCRRAHGAGYGVGYYTRPRFMHAHAVSTRGSIEETALYKSETVVSKCVYLATHEPNVSGRILRFLIRQQSLWGLPVYTILSRVTGGTFRSLELKKKIHQRLIRHFREVRKTGILLSEYAPNHPSRGPQAVIEVKPESTAS